MSEPVRLAIDVLIEAGDWSSVRDPEAIAHMAITRTTEQAGTRLKPDAEISVLLTDDAQVRELNRIWRQQDKPTNVLSFPAASAATLAVAPMLGDIVIACETVKREALAEGKTTEDHLSHLIVHGFLHLLGHDHVAEDDAEIMENLERRILASLSISDPYADKS